MSPEAKTITLGIIADGTDPFIRGDLVSPHLLRYTLQNLGITDVTTRQLCKFLRREGYQPRLNWTIWAKLGMTHEETAALQAERVQEYLQKKKIPT